MRGDAEHSLTDWKPGGGFWLRWTLITAVGFTLSFVLAFAITSLMSVYSALRGGVGLNTGMALAAAAGGIVVGAVMGFVQWTMIRHGLTRAGWWIPATALGSGLACLLTVVIAGAANGSAAWLLGGLVGGLVGGALAGYLQWRLTGEPLAGLAVGRWIGASAVAWAVGFAIIGMGMDSGTSGASAIRPGVILVILTAILGMLVTHGITGALVARLFRQPSATVHLGARNQAS